ncbi:copper chaperone PCu(A)C [Streptomyces sp. NPDC048172]|uniref:copper chaperone PCu(A)C n=1 Tax=Streptomyces sp. NPDC048172 TaxID=3365505 RepID=UPI00371BC4D8
MTERSKRSRGARDTVVAVGVPVAACAVTLLGLTAWTAAGGAGSPPELRVSEPRVFLTYAGRQDTSATFRITNTGRSGDRLVAVDSPGARHVMLSRHTHTASGAGRMESVRSLALPARTAVPMSATSTNVMLTAPDAASWRAGDTVPFELRFAHSPPVRVTATVVRPGS